MAGDGWAVAHRPPLEGLTRNYIEIKGTHHPPVTSNYPPLEETAIVNFSQYILSGLMYKARKRERVIK